MGMKLLFVISHVILVAETIENKVFVKIKISIGCLRIFRGKGEKKKLDCELQCSEGKKKRWT